MKPYNIHERAAEVSRTKGVPLAAAYRLLSSRGAASRRFRRQRAEVKARLAYGETF